VVHFFLARALLVHFSEAGSGNFVPPDPKLSPAIALPTKTMKKLPFTSYDVLQLWLETQIGNTHRLLPKGYDRASSSGASADTRARAASLVASMPLYDLCRPKLIEWCQVGLRDLGLVGELLASLDDHLRDYPFYATTARDMEDQARKPVRWLTVDEAAFRLGVRRDALRVKLDRLKTSLPFGTYKHERRWYVNPLDVEALRGEG
jgi:hypothetical protein